MDVLTAFPRLSVEDEGDGPFSRSMNEVEDTAAAPDHTELEATTTTPPALSRVKSVHSTRLGSPLWTRTPPGKPGVAVRRAHWQPDSSSCICSCGACMVEFSLFERRHHCRACGGLFANKCAQWWARCPDQSGTVDPHRCCRRCVVDIALRSTSAPSPPGEGFVAEGAGTLSVWSSSDGLQVGGHDRKTVSNSIVKSVQSFGAAQVTMRFCVVVGGVDARDDSSVSLHHCFVGGKTALMLADRARVSLDSCVVVADLLCLDGAGQSSLLAERSFLIGARRLDQRRVPTAARNRYTLVGQLREQASAQLNDGCTATATSGFNVEPDASVGLGPGSVVGARPSPSLLAWIVGGPFALAGPHAASPGGLSNTGSSDGGGPASSSVPAVIGRVLRRCVRPSPVETAREEVSSRKLDSSSERKSLRPDFLQANNDDDVEGAT